MVNHLFLLYAQLVLFRIECKAYICVLYLKGERCCHIHCKCTD